MGQLNVVVDSQPVATWQSSNPILRGAYVFSTSGVAGTTASNTFVTLFNPVGSGRTVFFGGAFLSTVNSGAVSATAPARGWRIATAPTGGTVQAASTVTKFQTIHPDTTMDIRTGNPTTALVTAIWNTPTSITTGSGGGGFVHAVDTIPLAGPFTLAPGEGVAVNQSAGSANEVWNVSLAWAEI